MLKGVLFDMDGVLFNTEQLAATAEKKAQQQMGISFPPELESQFLGITADYMLGLIDDYSHGEIDGRAFMALSHQLWDEVLEEVGMQKMPGLDEALDWLRANGYKIAVASSSRLETIHRNLGLTGLEGRFDALVGGDMGFASKPAPDIFLGAARALGLPPEQCAAVEDSYNGVRSASSAGCVTVMVPDLLQPTEEICALCSTVLPSLHHLPEYLQSLA